MSSVRVDVGTVWMPVMGKNRESRRKFEHVRAETWIFLLSRKGFSYCFQKLRYWPSQLRLAYPS